MKAARTGGGPLLYRTPAAVGNEEDRAVLGRRRRNRRRFIEDLESVELDHIFAWVAPIGIKDLQRQLLETFYRCSGISVDGDRVPRLENLGSELENGSCTGSQLERLALYAKTVDERRCGLHSPPSVAAARGTGARVAKKRATC